MIDKRGLSTLALCMAFFFMTLMLIFAAVGAPNIAVIEALVAFGVCTALVAVAEMKGWNKQ